MPGQIGWLVERVVQDEAGVCGVLLVVVRCGGSGMSCGALPWRWWWSGVAGGLLAAGLALVRGVMCGEVW